MTNDTYRSLLVPYDGSVFSQRALVRAKDLAKSFGSVLTIASIVDISSVPSPGLIRSGERKALERIRQSVMQSVRGALEKIQKGCIEEGIKTKILVMEGSAAASLLKIISENKIDMVIIGSRGLSGISRVKALGSVSRKISEVADCPVMIIR